MKRVIVSDREPAPDDPESDYFVVSGGAGHYHVSGETADRLIRQLTKPIPPRWLAFVDLHGSRVRVRSKGIDEIRERSTLQRQRERDFGRARRREAKEDRRPWEDDYDDWLW